MITIRCKDTRYTYNIYHLVKAFFPDEPIRQSLDTGQEPLAELVLGEGSCFSVAGEGAAGTEEDRAQQKRRVTRLVFQYLAEFTGKKLPWGMLTGVRPAKLAMNVLEAGGSAGDAASFMQEEYAVSEEKALLAAGIAQRERRLLGRLSGQEGFSLYVGIPFCPSVCSYCSFSSSPIARWRDRTDAYLDAVRRELEAIRPWTAGRRLDTVYIGGGTPTTLEPAQLDRLMGWIGALFPLEEALEYSVEAGRPDSITEEKLEVLRRYPVTRLSVNPQSMQQKTLDRIGRRHTPEEVRQAFRLARSLGFDNINMDLIAGLPGETEKDMQDTLEQIEALAPDSLTIHSLAVKRAARMNRQADPEGPACISPECITEMLQDGAQAAARMGMTPYYLYRQKMIAGNFENVGYARAGKAGIYNIVIMEEKQTIIACGAGGISKRVYPDGQIKRCENVKDVALYMEKIDEMIGRKRRLLERV